MHRHPPGAALGLGLLVGCITPQGYPCTDASQCILDGRQGRCEPEGFCSYPDDSCPSAQRFEARAGEGLAGECVEPGSSGSSGTAGSDSEGSAGACEVGAQRVFAGTYHSCALDEDERLWCWGANLYGQLGRDSNADAFSSPSLVELPAGRRIARLDAKEHVCALLDDGSVHCWGRNDAGQSDWSDEASIVVVPTVVQGLEIEPEVIAVGFGISCAAAGSVVRCWGTLGGGTPITLVDDLPGNVTLLAVGQLHGCAATDQQQVVCIGDDSLGQLGDGDGITMGGTAQVALPPHEAVVDLAAGDDHTCAILDMGDDHEVFCWGDNHDTQAGGLPQIDEVLFSPRAVADLEPGDYHHLSVDDLHGCVLDGQGSLYCWGRNDGGMSDPWAESWSFGAHRLEPPDGARFLDADTGLAHTCALTDAGRVRCWGCNAVFQLGPEPPSTSCSDADERLLGEVVIPCE
ncbi:MAG: hypothetical protein KC501_13310 [Myxococcales bacterium]|nr:hypothetical protein [Myxococcales bacterium]